MSADSKSDAAILSLRTHGLVLAMLLETNLIDVRSVVGWAVEQIQLPGAPTEARSWLFSSPPTGYLVISYHQNGDYCLVLDISNGVCRWYDHEDPGNPRTVGSSVEEMLDWLWAEAQQLASKD